MRLPPPHEGKGATSNMMKNNIAKLNNPLHPQVEEIPLKGSHEIQCNEPVYSKNKELNTKSPCCENPILNGYPAEYPVVNICFSCGEWNWINYKHTNE